MALPGGLDRFLSEARNSESFIELRRSVSRDGGCRACFLEIERDNAAPTSPPRTLQEALFQWCFYISNGYVPEGRADADADADYMAPFVDALRGVYYDYLKKTGQLEIMRHDVVPFEISMYSLTGGADSEYRHGVSIPSTIVNWGWQAGVTLVDAEMLAGCFGRLLFMAFPPGGQTLLHPGQSMFGRGSATPRPGLVEQAQKQHENKASVKSLDRVKLPEDAVYVDPQTWSGSGLVFQTNAGPGKNGEYEEFFIRTNLGVKDYPFPHDQEDSTWLKQPTQWQYIKPDDSDFSVTVKFRGVDNEKKYICPEGRYPGALIRYIQGRLEETGTRGDAIEEIEARTFEFTEEEKTRVPYIRYNNRNNSGPGHLSVEFEKDYYELAKNHAPRGFYGNASVFVSNMIF